MTDATYIFDGANCRALYHLPGDKEPLIWYDTLWQELRTHAHSDDLKNAHTDRCYLEALLEGAGPVTQRAVDCGTAIKVPDPNDPSELVPYCNVYETSVKALRISLKKRIRKLLEKTLSNPDAAERIANEILPSKQSTIALSSVPAMLRAEEERTSDEPFYSLMDLQEGDIFLFGRYPQTDCDKLEPIEWRVIKRTSNEALLLSIYGLDARKYNYERKMSPDWEFSDMRAWLNSSFLLRAFKQSERELLAGEVCLLSKEEIDRFLVQPGKTEDLMCYPTAYAKQSGVKADIHGTCEWLTRSPRSEETIVTIRFGFSGCNGGAAEKSAVRPAIWIKIG
ncbi:MAG: hypothetical protein IJH83_02710 [Coriobacteriales bacterium]|nr:hypothetical protein [Coriobacteriales bacterium]